MKKMSLTKSLALSMSLALSTTSFACDIQGHTGFLPENNLSIGVDDKMAGDMTEARFLEIIGRVSTTYAPIIKSLGATLKMNNLWTNNTVNASAQQSGKTWEVNMYGGLARHALTTDDGFMMVVCHELGHHIGGAPRYDRNSNWASNEGQADYFASLKCMRRVVQNDDNIAIVAKMKIDAEATKQCELVYKSAAEVALCQRISMAGKSLGALLGSLGGNANVKFETPDTKKVTKTSDSHPAAQCRLDTYFHGMLCDKAFDVDVSKNDPITGTCIKKDGYVNGVRPLCWYKPSTAEL